MELSPLLVTSLIAIVDRVAVSLGAARDAGAVGPARSRRRRARPATHHP